MLVRMKAELGEGFLYVRRKSKAFGQKLGMGRRHPTIGLREVVPSMDELERMVVPELCALTDVRLELAIATTGYEHGEPRNAPFGGGHRVLVREGGKEEAQDGEDVSGVLRE